MRGLVTILFAVTSLLILGNTTAFASCAENYEPTQLVCQNTLNGQNLGKLAFSSLDYDVVGKNNYSLLGYQWSTNKTKQTADRISKYNIPQAEVNVIINQRNLGQNGHTEIIVTDAKDNVLSSASGYIARYTGGMDYPTPDNTTVKMTVRTPAGAELSVQCVQQTLDDRQCI